MRLFSYSLKTGIVVTLVIILLTAMILLDIVMTSMAEKNMTKLEIKNGVMLLHSIEQDLISGFNKGSTSYSPPNGLKYLLNKKYLLSAAIINYDGRLIFETKTAEVDRKRLVNMARKSLQSGENSISTPGLSWGILSSKKGYFFLAYPVKNDNKLVGVASVKINLENTYNAVRVSHKIILLYIFLNALFFTLAGFYFIYRILVRPINRLVRKAEDFKEGESFYPFPSIGQNEFGKLSRAITIMLERLEDNRTELKRNISELEETNLELTKAQDEILRSEKLASVGRLASGVAHEIGNPISTIFGYLGLLRDSKDQGERIDFINRIEGEIDRINRTIRDLLDFSRPSKGIPELVSLHLVISDVIEMLKPQKIMSDITINLDMNAKKDTVLADPDKLKQLLLNITMNAIDAMDTEQSVCVNDDKKLSIKSSILPGTDSDVSKKGDTIHIECIDNGQGISLEELDRIFDPFFTTKEPGKGTGLGLSVSLRIVEDAGGKIKVKSEKGKGTTVAITLPLYET